MGLSDELLAIRLELKGVREAVEGFKSVNKAQESVSHSTTKAGAAASRAEKKTSGLTRAYQSLGKTARWGLGFLGVGGVFALKSAVENSEELSKTTTGLVRNLDLGTNAASRWGAVAHARDIDTKSLTMGFTTLSKQMVEAGRQGGTLLTPFHQLGITQAEAEKGAHNFEWGLMRVARALGEAEGGSVRQAAASKLLGRGYQTILPLFSEGTKGLKEQLHWADKYGVTLDGKTNASLMDMVQAQRESKVATLGLQLALTKALMPAIEGGQHELQKFIATLNDPNMSGDEKLAAIERQFEHLEDKLVDVLTAVLPHIAEHGGEFGVKLAGAVWHGFEESDAIGKFVIGAWLFWAMGGAGAIRTMGGKVGSQLARGLLWAFIPEVAASMGAGATFGAALGQALGGLKPFFNTMGTMLGRVMGFALVAGVILMVPGLREKIEDTVLGEELDATDREELATRLNEDGWDVLPWGPNGNVLKAKDPSGDVHVFKNKPHYGAQGTSHSWEDHVAQHNGRGGRRHGGRNGALPRAALTRPPRFAAQSLPRGRGWGGSRLGSVTVQVPLEGKVLAETAIDIAELEASLK